MHHNQIPNAWNQSLKKVLMKNNILKKDYFLKSAEPPAIIRNTALITLM